MCRRQNTILFPERMVFCFENHSKQVNKAATHYNGKKLLFIRSITLSHDIKSFSFYLYYTNIPDFSKLRTSLCSASDIPEEFNFTVSHCKKPEKLPILPDAAEGLPYNSVRLSGTIRSCTSNLNITYCGR